MPKKIDEITVFVSSPQDVVEERENLEEIIKEINIIWERQEVGMRLNLIKWETHVYPDMGEYPQDVINKQIDDYDIFIGIMWKRFGTQTENAGSGTEEEFESAYKKYQENPDIIKLMFYFNNAPIPPSEIDSQQILINEFREKLGDEGGLYWFYNGPDDFAQKIRMHLSMQLPYWKKLIEKEPTHPKSIESDVNESDIKEDEGFFELMEVGEENASELENISQRMADIGNIFQNEMENITLNDSTTLKNPDEIRKVSNQMATVMDKFASDIEEELPLFSESISNILDAYSRATLISTDFYKDKEEFKKVLISIKGAKSNFVTSLTELTNLENQLSLIPRITRPLNLSKKHTLKVLNSFSIEYNNAIKKMDDLEKSLQEMLSDLG
jgi:hypothetical protein